MQIRHGTTADISTLLPLLEELGYPTSYDALKNRFERFIMHLGYGVAVCEINKEIVGFIAWSKSPLFVLDKTRFHIEAIVVKESYRFQRVGQKLIIFLETIAQKSGPSIIDLTSGLRRAKDGSHDFYKKLGYKNEGPMAKLYLRKEL